MEKTKRFNLYIYIELISAVLFSLLSVSFHADISLLAFPLAAGFTALAVFYVYFKMLRHTDGKKAFGSLRFLEYLPFVLLLSFILRRAGKNGTYYWYDLIQVLLWCVVFISSLINAYIMNEKRIKNYTTDWNVASEKTKFSGKAKIIFEVIDWIDALVQAIFMVLLIQIFILQLYVIPSESMVPEYLVKDKVAVLKFDCGPKFPLTEIGLTDFKPYKRGQIVVLRNPHYKLDRKSEVKTVTSQLVFMLTFTKVNLNKDEDGKIKADPLVKRITGLPGEQLVMQDGILYARTKDSDEFKPVTEDEKYACWNLNALQKNIKAKVQEFKFTQEGYEAMLQVESLRRSYDLNKAQADAEEMIESLKKMTAGKIKSGTFSEPSLFLNNWEFNYLTVAGNILNQNGGVEWFEKFITSWIPAKDVKKDMYADAAYKLEVMHKIIYGKIITKIASYIYEGNMELINSDEKLKNNTQLQYYFYVYQKYYQDERNMPVFPANDENGNAQYIPENCYFMMGDNRFNSLDMRHTDKEYKAPVTEYDPMPIEYASFMKPQYVNKSLIIGKPVIRLTKRK